MKSAIAKRSVVISGHKTSVSLEEPFWNAIRALAEAQQVTVSSLLRQINLERRHANLSSAIRIYVLEQTRAQLAAADPSGHGHLPGHHVRLSDLSVV